VATEKAKEFDQWVRHGFRLINTELELLYNQQAKPEITRGVGTSLKNQLIQEGGELIQALLLEGNTDEGFDRGFDLLGNVGFFMAACRRHELDMPNQDIHQGIHCEALQHTIKTASALSFGPPRDPQLCA